MNNLAKREKIMVACGGVIVLIALIYHFSTSVSATPDPMATNNLKGAIAQIDEYARLRDSVALLTERLEITVPTVSMPDQEIDIRDDVYRLAQGNNVTISKVGEEVRSSGRNRDQIGKPLKFTLDVAGRFESVIAFIYGLENMGKPYEVVSYSLKAARVAQQENTNGDDNSDQGGGTRGRGGNTGRQRGNTPGQVSGKIKIQAFVFPEVFLVERAEEPEEATGRGRRGRGNRPSEDPIDSTEAEFFEEDDSEQEFASQAMTFQFGGDFELPEGAMAGIQEMMEQFAQMSPEERQDAGREFLEGDGMRNIIEAFPDELIMMQIGSMSPDDFARLPARVRNDFEEGKIDREDLTNYVIEEMRRNGGQINR